MKLIQQSKLYFKEGNSDKVYEIDLCQLSENEYIVNFRYGRRGSTLKPGTKTPEAVNRKKAESIFTALENEKRKKGYQPEVEVSIDLPPMETVNPETPTGAILQRLQDAITGKSSFKTQWKTSRVIWKAGEMGIQEAIPYILRLATQGNELQTYSSLWALLQLKTDSAVPLFQAFAFQQKQKAYIRHIACEGLLSILTGEELNTFSKELLGKLPSEISQRINENDYQKLSTILAENSAEGKVNYFSHLYLLSKIYPELIVHIHAAIRTWDFRPPWFKHIRSIYKLAQVRKDYPTLAILSYGFEKRKAMFKRNQSLDSRYNQYIQSLETSLRVGTELKSEDSRIAFSHYTKAYFQRNSLEFVRKTGDNSEAKEYLRLAVSILLQYTEEDYVSAGERPQYEYGIYNYTKKLYYFTLINYPECYNSPLLSTILFGNDSKRELQKNFNYIYGKRTVSSQNYWYNPSSIINTSKENSNKTEGSKSIFSAIKSLFSGSKNVQSPVENISPPIENNPSTETYSRTELYPEHWDAMPVAYVQLLMQAKMNVIHQFAYNNLKSHPALRNICDKFDEKAILQLLNSDFELPRQLGYETLESRKEELSKQNDFVGKVLASKSSNARLWAQQVITNNTEFYLNDLNFIYLLISNTIKENKEWINSLLQKQRFTEERQQALLGKLVAELLQLENTDTNNQLAKVIISRINIVAIHQLEKISWDIVEQLITSPLLSNIQLASNILTQKSRKIDPTEIPVSVVDLFLRNEIVEVRHNGIQLLNQYPLNFLIDNYNFILNQVDNPWQDVVEDTLTCISKLLRSHSLGNETVRHFVYVLIRREKYEGVHNTISNYILNELKPYWNSGLIPKDITKLVHAQYRQSQLTGYEILKEYNRPDEFTLGQIISFGNHELLAVRHWCWNYFKEHANRIRFERDKALGLLDAKWDDTRAYAFQFFKTEFKDADWDTETLIGIVDSIRPDVESFGKELITHYFKPENALEYLTKLSEHPSINVQAFISTLLTNYATNNKDIIRGLEYYFRSVLTRVNKGRVAKNRILNFLHKEALNNVEVAEIIVPIIDDMSAQSTIQDKAACINILTEIKSTYPHLDMHLTIKS